VGGIAIIASLIFGFGYANSLSFDRATNHVSHDAIGTPLSFSEAEVFLIDTLITAMTILSLLLSISLIAVGAILRQLDIIAKNSQKP